jgi:D-sedoheptulose 7-phosphate isomerase
LTGKTVQRYDEFAIPEKEEPVKERIQQNFQESIATKQSFLASHLDKIIEVTDKMVSVLERGGKVLFFGNGGSACDASHLAGELVNRFYLDRKGLAGLSLTTDMSVITSISNDYHYHEIFARQIESLGKEGDMAIAISTSGNSANVIRGVEMAKSMGLITVGFTGGNGGKLAPIADVAFIVPSKVTPRIQETHITLGHVICELVEERLCKPKT